MGKVVELLTENRMFIKMIEEVLDGHTLSDVKVALVVMDKEGEITIGSNCIGNDGVILVGLLEWAKGAIMGGD